MSPKRKASGFTVGEILITLCILGVVGTFAIAKTLTTQQDLKKKAIFKDDIEMIQGAFYDILSEGGINNYTEENFTAKINAIQVCHNASTQGCWSAAQGANGESGQPGFTMANGSTIMGFDDNNSNPANGVIIDYNGSDGPNQIGQDQLHIVLCYTAPACNGWFTSGSNNAGDLGPINWEVAANLSLWQEVWAR